jgi:acylphosphatase
VPIPESRCHAFVSGIVQGVGFRYFVRDEAVKAGAVGWVRNLHDGRVEFIAEGTTSGLQALMKQVRRGPLGGRVDHLEEDWGKPTGEFKAFRVERTA